MRYIVLLIELLMLASCNYNMESKNESSITEKMRKHISDTVKDSYGFFECNVVKEHIDRFNWITDMYRIQKDIYLYASQRRTVIANSYIPLVNAVKRQTQNIFDMPFEEPKGYANKIKESYLTTEEREICDFVYYGEFVPRIQKIIRDLENEEFHGDRIYYACGYRIASGAVVYKQYVLYKKDDSESITICEVNYNYEMLRAFVQYTLNVDLDAPLIKDLVEKYKGIEQLNRSITDQYIAICKRF